VILRFPCKHTRGVFSLAPEGMKMKAGNDTGSFWCTGAVKDTYDRQLFGTCLIVSAQITTGSAE